MPPRKPHTKSRLGCIRCKEKHIKCDEVRPTCGACARVKVQCILKTPVILSKPVVRQRCSSRPHTSAPESPHGPAHVIQQLTAPSTPVSTEPNTRNGFSMWEFELMHHYIIHVTETFDSSLAVLAVWRDYAIKEAMRHEFLMHITLIISCLHLALTKSPCFTNSHQDLILAGCSNAMSWFRKEVEHVNQSNWRAVGPFAFLMSVYALALPLLDDTHNSADKVIEDMIQILSLIGATRNLVEIVHEQNEQDDEPWTKEEDMRDVSRGIPTEDFDVDSVTRTLVACIDLSGDDSQTRAINLNAVHGFRKMSDLNFKEFLRPFIWPNMIDQDFLTLLKQRNPTALAILAHHAIILGQCSSKWWCADWGVRLMSAVAMVIPNSFAQVIAYPLEKLKVR